MEDTFDIRAEQRSVGNSEKEFEKALVSEAQEKHDELNQHVNETLSVSGSMLVKLFCKEKTEYEKFKKEYILQGKSWI